MPNLRYHSRGLAVEGIEGLVEFEPSVTRGESCYEDVGFAGPVDGILLDACKTARASWRE